MRCMAKSGPIPSHQKLAALGQASLVHAREQLADAELLLEHGRWPLAHAVATLALEEVGKAHLCFTCMTMPEQFRAGNWFWPAFNSHTAKLMIAQFIFQMFAQTQTPPPPLLEAIAELGSLAGSDHATKMRGLYVDYQDEVVLDPADITEQTARRMVSNVSTCLAFMVPLDDSGQVSELAEFTQAWSTMLAENLDSVTATLEADPDTLIRNLWDALHGDATQNLSELLPGLPSVADITDKPRPFPEIHRSAAAERAGERQSPPEASSA